VTEFAIQVSDLTKVFKIWNRPSDEALMGRIRHTDFLGTGFHLDCSGRENAFSWGMSRSEVKRRFDGIVEFSELSEFVDRPFRTYSNGMQARLTFAVANSIDSDPDH
jgi:lipopolysaccharide transport system ATP-binding protein